MRKVFLLYESWTASYEESDSVLDIYQFEVDAIMACNRLTMENKSAYTVYSVEVRALQ